MSISQELMLIYNITVYENKIYVDLNEAKTIVAIIRHQHATRVWASNFRGDGFVHA